MRVAFVIGKFPSLSVTFIINQITALIDRGHEVDIYAGKPGDIRKVHAAVHNYALLDRTTYSTYSPTKPQSYPVRVSRVIRSLFAHPLTNPGGRLRVLNVFKHGKSALSLNLLYQVMPFLPQRKYDVIHCHFAPNALRVLAAHEAGILHGKLLTTFHGYDVNTYPRRHGKDVYRKLFQHGDLYTANSAFTAQRAVALGCPPDRIVKLPVGVDPEVFDLSTRGLEPGAEIRILTVGRLVEVKGIEYGIRAVAKIVPTHPNIRYQIAGDGPLLSELKELAAKLGVADHVDFLGGQTQEELRRLYARSHLFMLPGVVGGDGAEEGQGLVLIEAQATGLPVLATRVGGIPESVLDGESGFLVSERDMDALAEKLTYLIEHPELWPGMGRAGRAFIERSFDINKLNAQLVDLYRRLLSGP